MVAKIVTRVKRVALSGIGDIGGAAGRGSVDVVVFHGASLVEGGWQEFVGGSSSFFNRHWRAKKDCYNEQLFTHSFFGGYQMPRPETPILTRLLCQTNQGDEIIIIERTRRNSYSSNKSNGGRRTVSGTKDYETEDGLDVTRIDDLRFKIVDTGEIVKRSS